MRTLGPVKVTPALSMPLTRKRELRQERSTRDPRGGGRKRPGVRKQPQRGQAAGKTRRRNDRRADADKTPPRLNSRRTRGNDVPSSPETEPILVNARAPEEAEKADDDNEEEEEVSFNLLEADDGNVDAEGSRLRRSARRTPSSSQTASPGRVASHDATRRVVSRTVESPRGRENERASPGGHGARPMGAPPRPSGMGAGLMQMSKGGKPCDGGPASSSSSSSSPRSQGSPTSRREVPSPTPGPSRLPIMPNLRKMTMRHTRRNFAGKRSKEHVLLASNLPSDLDSEVEVVRPRNFELAPNLGDRSKRQEESFPIEFKPLQYCHCSYF